MDGELRETWQRDGTSHDMVRDAVPEGFTALGVMVVVIDTNNVEAGLQTSTNFFPQWLQREMFADMLRAAADDIQANGSIFVDHVPN